MDHFKELGFNVRIWLRTVEEQYKNEVKNGEQNVLPIKLLKQDVRATIWFMSEIFGVEKNGVPGLACHLLERFLANKLYALDFQVMDVSNWQAYNQSQMSQIVLWMTSCIRLAGKMSCSAVNLRCKIIQLKLAGQDLYYTQEEITAAELEVFKELEFHVPMWTSVEIAEILATEIKASDEVLKSVHTVVNNAELHRDSLNSKLQWIADVPNSSYSHSADDSRIQITHLAAASVIAAGRYNSVNNPDTINHLAEITRAPVPYIKCISDLILSVILDDS